MNQRTPRRRLPFVALFAALFAAPAHAQPDNGLEKDQELETSPPAEDRTPTAAQRAANWEPDPDATGEREWFGSAAIGTVYFSGDDGVDNDPGFSVAVKIGRELAGDFYVTGSYLFAVAETTALDPRDDTLDTEDHMLHLPTIGVGYRAEFTPEIHGFIEPRIGVLFGSDVDAGPAAGASTGLEIQLDAGIAIRFAFTALATDASLETVGGNADLNAIYSFGVGIGFEF